MKRFLLIASMLLFLIGTFTSAAPINQDNSPTPVELSYNNATIDFPVQVPMPVYDVYTEPFVLGVPYRQTPTETLATYSYQYECLFNVYYENFWPGSTILKTVLTAYAPVYKFIQETNEAYEIYNGTYHGGPGVLCNNIHI